MSYFAFPTPRLKIVGTAMERRCPRPARRVEPLPAPRSDLRRGHHCRLHRRRPDGGDCGLAHGAGDIRRPRTRRRAQAGVGGPPGRLGHRTVHVLALDDPTAARAYALAHGLDLDDLSGVPEVGTDRDRTARRRGPSLRSGQSTARTPHPPPRSGRSLISRQAFDMVRTGRAGAGPRPSPSDDEIRCLNRRSIARSAR